VDVLEGSMAVG